MLLHQREGWDGATLSEVERTLEKALQHLQDKSTTGVNGPAALAELRRGTRHCMPIQTLACCVMACKLLLDHTDVQVRTTPY